jgi:hypothetical protein
LLLIFDLVYGQPSEIILKSKNFEPPVLAGTLERSELRETSGIAASRRDSNILWAINDGGNSPVLYAFGNDGKDHGAVFLKDINNRDWEDLASFVLDGIPYLIIADIGDNDAKRAFCVLYILREPKVTYPFSTNIPRVRISKVIKFRYEDGPKDSEALAVDEKTRQICIISKRVKPPALYTLSLEENPPKAVQTARRISQINTLLSPTLQDIKKDPLFGHFGAQPTAMDISRIDGSIALLTYKRAYWFKREADESLEKCLSRDPEIIDFSALRQAEAISFAPNGRDLLITTEKRPAPLIFIKHLQSLKEY